MSKRPKRRGGFCLVGPIGGPATAGLAPAADEAPRVGARAPASHDQIALRAREIWEVKGCPADRDVEIWLAAEREMSARR